MKRSTRLLISAVIALFSSAIYAEETPDKYQSSCFACHAAGAAGAPRTGDAVAWAPQIEQGLETLISSVRNGKGAMPPNGLCADCTDDDLKTLIEFMSGHQF